MGSVTRPVGNGNGDGYGDGNGYGYGDGNGNGNGNGNGDGYGNLLQAIGAISEPVEDFRASVLHISLKARS